MLTFLTGLIASMAHVATGPDHLAAVTPLAIDSRKKSWIIGFSWGLGHTAGMLLIGALFIVFKEFLPIEAISKHSESVIGILLIGIGIWALARMYRRHTHGYIPHVHFHTKPFLYPHIHKHTHPVPLIDDIPVDQLQPEHPHDHHHGPYHHLHGDDSHDRHQHSDEKHEHSHDGHEHSHEKHVPFEVGDTHSHEKHAHLHGVHDHKHDHHHHDHDPDHKHGHAHILDYGHGHAHTGKVKQNAFSAFLIGTVHGFAGFSHLFALLPSLALPTIWASVIYVIAFASGTIFTMVAFAFILGIVAHRSEAKEKLQFLKWFSLTGALLAIAIGVLWIFHPI